MSATDGFLSHLPSVDGCTTLTLRGQAQGDCVANSLIGACDDRDQPCAAQLEPFLSGSKHSFIAGTRTR
jgi:hypothetical protein